MVTEWERRILLLTTTNNLLLGVNGKAHGKAGQMAGVGKEA
jgi:hypothetical protein